MYMCPFWFSWCHKNWLNCWFQQNSHQSKNQKRQKKVGFLLILLSSTEFCSKVKKQIFPIIIIIFKIKVHGSGSGQCLGQHCPSFPTPRPPLRWDTTSSLGYPGSILITFSNSSLVPQWVHGETIWRKVSHLRNRASVETRVFKILKMLIQFHTLLWIFDL